MAKKKKVGIEVSDAKQARELILTESSPFNMLEAYKAARTNLIFTMIGMILIIFLMIIVAGGE